MPPKAYTLIVRGYSTRETPVTREEIVDMLSDCDEEILLADGFEDAFLGVAERCGGPSVAVYDYELAMAVLVRRDGLSEEEADEYLQFNVIGAYAGPNTPYFLTVRAPETRSAESRPGNSP